MNKHILLKFLAGLYGFMQLELKDSKLVNKDGAPKPTKNMSLLESDGIAIYKYLSGRVKHLDVRQIREYAEYTNAVTKKLINEEKLVNNYLLALMLYRSYLDELAPRDEQILMLAKVGRSIQHYELIKGKKYSKIRKTTSRCADNIWRVFTGRAQLGDDVRDLLAKRYLKT